MKVHVLPGDSLVGEFNKADIDGEVIVCRECLVAGPVDAGTRYEFWDQRARFILTEYGEDEIEYHEKVADELEKLAELPPDAEVNLWFEYELFCSVNLWFCLSLLSGTKAAVYRVEPSELSTDERWSGFGKMDADDLKKCFTARKKLGQDEIKLGADLWDAFRSNDLERLKALTKTESDCFRYLSEVGEAAHEADKKVKKILTEIRCEGKTEFAEIFSEFSLRAGAYGYGDLQVARILEQLDH